MLARVLQLAHAQTSSGGGLHADLCHDRVLGVRRGSLRLRRHPQRLHRPLRRQQYQFEPPERLRQPLRDCVLPGHALRVPADRSNRLQHLVSVLQRRLRCREPDTVGDRPDSNQLQSCLLRAVQVVSGAAVLRSERDRLSMSWRPTRRAGDFSPSRSRAASPVPRRAGRGERRADRARPASTAIGSGLASL